MRSDPGNVVMPPFPNPLQPSIDVAPALVAAWLFRWDLAGFGRCEQEPKSTHDQIQGLFTELPRTLNSSRWPLCCFLATLPDGRRHKTLEVLQPAMVQNSNHKYKKHRSSTRTRIFVALVCLSQLTGTYCTYFDI